MPPSKYNIFSRMRHSASRVQHIPLVLLCGLLIFSHSVTRSLDHDEHQFVASAALLERRGLLPYRDYPYFHMPYLIFADTALFRLAGPSAKLLLTARLFSAACGFATVALLSIAVQTLYGNRPPRTRRLATALTTVLLLTNPIFTTATGLAWNHDAAELLLVGAALLFLRNVRRGTYGPASMLAAGGVLGLGIGVRLTIAPAIAAFLGTALADQRVPWRRRVVAAAYLLLGSIIALAPCAWLFLQSPRGFVFGNFEYPALNTAYRMARGSMASSTAPTGKIVYFFSRLVFSSGTGILLVLIALTMWLRLTNGATSANSPRCQARSIPDQQEMNFLGLLILFLLVGSFAPAPMFMVYFYAPIPFAVLWLAYAWRPLLDWDSGFDWRIKAATALVFACIACGIPAPRNVAAIFRPRSWPPLVVHESGIELRRHLAAVRAAPGPVLTLAPLIPLEGGLDVYEQYATGPFALRVAPMVPEPDRCALHLPDEHDLKKLLRDRPPAAVLFNVEASDEEAPMLRALPQICPAIRLVPG